MAEKRNTMNTMVQAPYELGSPLAAKGMAISVKMKKRTARNSSKKCMT